MKTLDEILAILRNHRAEVRRMFRAELVGVFGSVARSDHQEASDVDILVRFLPGASLFDWEGLADFLEERLKMKVDVVPADTVREEIRDHVFQEAVYL